MRRLLLLVGTIVLVDMTFYAAITPLLPDYADRYGLSTSQAGLLGAAYAAGTLIAALPSGLLAVRWGPRRTVLLGLALMAVASLGFAFGRTVLLLDATRFLQGVGGACSYAGGMGWLLSSTAPERRGETIGAAMVAGVVGILLGPVLGTLARALGPEVPFASIAVIGVVLMAVAMRTPLALAGAEAGAGLAGARVRDAWRTRRVRGGMAFVLLPALAFGAMNVLTPLELDRLGAGGLLVGAVYLVAAAIEAAVQLVVGRASDRHGRVLFLRVSLAGSCLCMLLLTLPGSVVALVPAIVLSFVVVGSLYTPAMALLSDGAAAAGLAQGMAFALVNLVWAGGQVVGAVAGSGIADAWSEAVTWLLLAALLGGALAVLTVARRAPVATA
ncbi:MFS transporter [Conexibacter sp. JD483]|uniref:MFS transporter n=1 Tax=unclassified Conexibacter TaxID=2627773 RepID=UPI00271AB6DD|nr:MULTISPECIES: MFS transporter [unclassified Conexibacter]MDO8184773.1 MFS transporter [Conexibacter sp. CPCC 205706]MDO8196548.1 MFS transporter [Conexibacter sp. CPCC 205762]MDR9369034.1 MFS transporter [Conexibacter sp. JD483]